MKFYVRDTKSDDLETITQIEKDNFSLPWKFNDFKKALDDKQIFKVVYNEKEVIGYFLALVVCDEAQVATIAVKKEFRKLGCGKKILEAAILEAWIRGVDSMYLEVRKSNIAALNLYEHIGFERLGERKNFYESPKEDAITMKFNVKGIWRR